MCLLNCISTTAGWIEWGYQKLNARHLRSKGMTQGALDYLMWHHFGRVLLFMTIFFSLVHCLINYVIIDFPFSSRFWFFDPALVCL